MLEYEDLKESDLFSAIKRRAFSDDTITGFVHNIRQLPRHVVYLVSENRVIINDIIGFTETQIKSSDSTCKTIEMLIFLTSFLITMKINF